MDSIKKKAQSNAWRLGVAERRVLLIFGDVVMALIALGVALAYWVSGVDESLGLTLVEFIRIRTPIWFFMLPVFWLLLLVETYNARRASDWRETISGLAVAALIGMGVYTLLYFTSEPGSLPRRGVAGFALTAWMLTTIWRWLYIRIFSSPQFVRRAVLVGAGRTGQALLEVINSIQPPPYHLVGLVDDDPEKQDAELGGYPVLGGAAALEDLIEQEGLSDILVAIAGRIREDMFTALLDAQERGVEIIRMPVAYEELLDRVPVHHLEADWMLRSFVDEARVSRFYQMAKRIVDLIGGLVGVLLLILLTPFIVIGTLLDSGWPVTFSQTRAGKGGHPYRIIKFRTMRQDAEKEGNPVLAQEDDERSTRLGRFLRKTRLDEWPQFINVLRGEMSLVGPRPERPEFVSHFEDLIPFYRARLLVKPGITGWAQVNFDYASTIEDMSVKLEYDLYYIKRRSILLDMVILLRTIATVVGFRGR